MIEARQPSGWPAGKNIKGKQLGLRPAARSAGGLNIAIYKGARCPEKLLIKVAALGSLAAWKADQALLSNIRVFTAASSVQDLAEIT